MGWGGGTEWVGRGRLSGVGRGGPEWGGEGGLSGWGGGD